MKAIVEGAFQSAKEEASVDSENFKAQMPGERIERKREGANQRSAVLIIGASQSMGLELRDLWAHRDLFYFLAWRDVKVRYKQTALGAIWAILQPLLTMIVFTFLFGKVARVPSEGQPYAIF